MFIKGITQYDSMVRSGQFRDAVNNVLTYELLKKNILIMGFGRIGRILIKRCLGFEMNVEVYDPFVNKNDIENHGGVKVDNLSNSLKKSDFISIHMPSTKKLKI